MHNPFRWSILIAHLISKGIQTDPLTAAQGSSESQTATFHIAQDDVNYIVVSFILRHPVILSSKG
jgi:hypothetical protein